MSITEDTPLPVSRSDAPPSVPRVVPPPPPRPVSQGAMPAVNPELRTVSGLLPSIDDIDTTRALRTAGVLAEADDEELGRMLRTMRPGKGMARRLNLLDAYYRAGGDAEKGRARGRADRYFVYREDESLTARNLVVRLCAVAPEIGAATLERIGSGVDGQLVLRTADATAGVWDEFEESQDTNEIDLREIEGGAQMVTIRGLVRAVNVLLEKSGVRERLVQLRGDDVREVYLGFSMTAALALLEAGLLEEETAEDLLELCAW